MALDNRIDYIGIRTRASKLPIIQVDIDLSNHCNYDCSYCGPWFNGGTTEWCDYKKLVSFLESVLLQNPETIIFLQLKGGEPTQWPDLNKFLEVISTYDNIYVGIITNLSRTKRFWQEINYSRVTRVMASFHAAQADTTQFLENAKVLWDHSDSIAISLLLLMDKPYFEKISDLKNRLENLEHPYDKLTRVTSPVRVLLPNDTVTQYSNEEEKIINSLQGNFEVPQPKNHASQDWLTTIKDVNEHSLENSPPDDENLENKLQEEQLDYRGWKCYAGIRKLMIDSNGDIYGAQCKIMKLGNLNSTWEFNTEPVTCSIRYCCCLSDIQIPKYNPKYVNKTLADLETT